MDTKNNSVNTLKSLIKVVIISLSATLISYGLKQMGIEKDKTIMVFLVGVLVVTTVTSGYFYYVRHCRDSGSTV